MEKYRSLRSSRLIKLAQMIGDDSEEDPEACASRSNDHVIINQPETTISPSILVELQPLPVQPEPLSSNLVNMTLPSSPNLSEDILSTENEDFGSSSSADFIPGTDESVSDSSTESVPRPKRRRIDSPGVFIEETQSNAAIEEDVLRQGIQQPAVNTASCSFWEEIGLNVEGKRKKNRWSVKERRADRAKRKLLRNMGSEYKTKAGKLVKPRQQRELNDCRRKCKDRIPCSLRTKIFDEYWKQGSQEKRVHYVQKFIDIQKKKTTKTTSPKKKRTYSNKYYVTDDDHNKIPVCKACLMRLLDESSRFIQTVCENIQKFGRMQPSRKSTANSRKITDEVLNEVKVHILSFPTTESHYGRSKTTKKFLNSELTLKKMYELYLLSTGQEKPVSKTIYRKVFLAFNISFKRPAIDTCSKCDRIKMKLRYTTGEAAVELAEELRLHEIAYKAAYAEKQADKLKCQSSDDVVVVTFDLQQCLPTPLLTTNVAFYKRQLWTYNLTIHDLRTNKAFCYMWPENIGGRGANDIASCLYDFITKQLPALNPNAKHLILYSDSCSGQNKNSIVTTMLMIAANLSTQLLAIEHKFLIPGHTHMEADSDHALIERKKKHTSMDIHLPRDWYQLVRSASNNTSKMNVIEMTQCMFFDFNDFAKQNFTIKKVISNIRFVWNNVRVLKYEKNLLPSFFYKNDYGREDFYPMDYGKRGRVYDLVTINTVKKCYTSEIPISAAKKKDLLALLEFIHESAHEFYRKLECKANVSDLPPDVDDDPNEDLDEV